MTSEGSEARVAAATDVLLGRWSVGVSLVIVAVAVGGGAIGGWGGGLGVDLCWFHRLTGLPCPGCGLTRGVVGLARGELASAIGLHPFALPVLSYASLAASSVLWPGPLRRRVERALARWQSQFATTYAGTIAAFLGFGLARAAMVALGLIGWS